MEKLRGKGGRDKVTQVVVSSRTRSGTSVCGSYPSQHVTASSPWEGFHHLQEHMPKRIDSSHVKCVSAFRASLLPVTCGWPAGLHLPFLTHCVYHSTVHSWNNECYLPTLLCRTIVLTRGACPDAGPRGAISLGLILVCLVCLYLFVLIEDSLCPALSAAEIAMSQ